MAQYDLHLIQNVAAAGIEFSEKQVNIAKGGLLSAIADGTPTVLAGGTDGYILKRDDAEATGLKWVSQDAGHTQNTDTGTTAAIFSLDSDGNDVELKVEDANTLGIRTSGDAGYADLKIDGLTLGTGSQVDTIETTITDDDTHLPSSGAVVDYVATAVSDALAANDAMIFKGTVGSGGTHEIAAFNALATYNAGWTYRVITAGTIKGVVCEVGDILTAMVDRAGSGELDADWTVMQTNLDGAVIGPASVTDNYLVQFDGTSGKLIKAGSGAPGTMAYASTDDYVAKALFDANTILAADSDNTPAAVTVAEQTLVGRVTSGNIAALTPAQAMNVLWVSAPATKTSSGTAGQIAKDANYFYICTGTDTWKRSPIATNWT